MSLPLQGKGVKMQAAHLSKTFISTKLNGISSQKNTIKTPQ